MEYSLVVAAHLFFSSYFRVCHSLVSPEGWRAQQFTVEKYPVDDPDLERVGTLQGKRHLLMVWQIQADSIHWLQEAA